jgi:glycosyltransferase involved in cell wall biosynthesis
MLQSETSAKTSAHVSVVIPVLNEAASLLELIERTDTTLKKLTQKYEILVVDDGSTDESALVLRELAKRYAVLRVVRFRRNYGKAAALSEGFSRARGEYLITLDGDLQDAPEEIPRFITCLEEGMEVVCGWKQNRQDSVDRVIGSRLFNAGTRLLTGLKLHDMNCGMKGYHRKVVQELRLYGEMHRFIPVIARNRGFTVDEIPIKHFPRKHGRSRYGWSRPLSGLFDLITLLMLGRYTHKPLHFFGLIGIASTTIGVLIVLFMSINWFQGEWIGNRPIFLVGIFLLLTGMQFIFFGLLAELMIFLSARREDCGIAEVLNEEQAAEDRDEKDEKEEPKTEAPTNGDRLNPAA